MKDNSSNEIKLIMIIEAIIAIILFIMFRKELLAGVPFIWMLYIGLILLSFLAWISNFKAIYKQRKNKKNLQDTAPITKYDPIERIELPFADQEPILQLIDCCVAKKQQPALQLFINSEEVLNQFIDENGFYGDPIWYIIENYAIENDINFFIHLDCKSSSKEFCLQLKPHCQSLLGREIELPHYEEFEHQWLIKDDFNAFKVYDKAIRKEDLQLSLIQTGGDEYVLVVHKTADLNKVKQAIHQLGYEHSSYDE